MSRHIKIDFDSTSSALVRGYGSRELLVEAKRGRAPLWSTINRAWGCSASTAINAIALAESRGWDVTVTGVRSKVEWTRSSPDVDHPDIEVAEAGLW